MKTYRPSYIPALILGVAGTLTLLSIIFSPRHPIMQADLFSKLFFVCYALFYAALTVGIFYIRITIDSKTLRNIAPLQWKDWKGCNIADIKSISRCGTFNILTSVYKSLCVKYHTDQGLKTMKINLNLYPEIIMQRLIHDLKVINPNIEVHGF
jgi:hypothetical protein